MHGALMPGLLFRPLLNLLVPIMTKEFNKRMELR